MQYAQKNIFDASYSSYIIPVQATGSQGCNFQDII